ncbi:DUF4123 domain-containing protein [Niveibacterium sp.]|uniref:DUF4123 domain-containing protein n=1 Tax=Niveibacterium sp. TaxID=2017444 RepID=UPI0035B345B9
MRIDPLPPSNIAVLTEALRRHTCAVDTSDAPDAHIYAVVDQLFLPDAESRRRLAISQWPNHNLLDHLGGAGDHHSVFLVALPKNGERLSAAIRRLCQACDGRPMLSFVVSRAPFAALAEHLRKYTEARLAPDDDEYLLRIGDTRVLSAILNSLGDAQRVTLLAPLIAWLHIDRNGSLIETPGLDSPDRLAHDMPHLAPEHWQALIDAAWPDAVLAQLDPLAPAAWQADLPSRRHAAVTQWLMEATEIGHDDPATQIAYCLSQLEI